MTKSLGLGHEIGLDVCVIGLVLGLEHLSLAVGLVLVMCGLDYKTCDKTE